MIKRLNIALCICLSSFMVLSLSEVPLNATENETKLSVSKSTQPVAIYHAFNMRYVDIIKILPRIATYGYSHVQISPVQKSRTVPQREETTQETFDKEKEQWWLRYQPTNFLDFNNWQGTEDELRELALQAKNLNLELIADVVFNHVAALDGLEEPEWSKAKHECEYGVDCRNYRTHLSRLELYENFSMHECFKIEGNRDKFLNGDQETYNFCMRDFSEWSSCDKSADYHDLGRASRCWMYGALPDLRPSDHVFDVHKQHLQKLLDMGIIGFRFDAARAIKRDLLKKYVNFLKEKNAFFYFEYAGCSLDEQKEVASFSPLSDFIFFSILKTVFAFDGDLRQLRNYGHDTSRGVLFAETHDTASNRIDSSKGSKHRISDERDMELALCYLLATKKGIPIILSENTNAKDVPEGVRFRSFLNNKKDINSYENGEHIYNIENLDMKNIMVMGRNDDKGIFILNKSTDGISINLKDVIKKQYSYKQIVWNLEKSNFDFVPVDESNLYIEGRSAMYLISRDK